eukprot:3073016-Prorocentrum_lima.AAC.1
MGGQEVSKVLGMSIQCQHSRNGMPEALLYRSIKMANGCCLNSRLRANLKWCSVSSCSLACR